MTEHKSEHSEADIKAQDDKHTLYSFSNKLQFTANYIRGHLKKGLGKVAVVLGSGLGDFPNLLQDAETLTYGEIGVPVPAVLGHAGKLICGSLANDSKKRIMCFSGRVHYYEGWRSREINFVTRLCSILGVELMIATNAAGGGNDIRCGGIVILRDHIRFSSVNGLCDTFEDRRYGPRHFDTANGYSERIAKIAHKAAASLSLPDPIDSKKTICMTEYLYEGNYCGSCGPTYETPSEVQTGLFLDVQSFGMSTVPEVCAANALNMEVFGMSLCTNKGAGLSDDVLNHEDVKAAAALYGGQFQKFLERLLEMTETLPRDAKKTERCHCLSTPPTSRIMHPYNSFIPSVKSLAEDMIIIRKALKGATFACPSSASSSSATATAITIPTAIWLAQGTNFLAGLFKSKSEPSPSELAALGWTLSSEVRVLSFADLPNFSANARSPSARDGKFLFTSVTTKKQQQPQGVVFITHQYLEGMLYHDEIAYIMQLLAWLGVNRLTQIVLAGQTPAPKKKEEKEKEKVKEEKEVTATVINLLDTMNRTSQSFPYLVCYDWSKTKEEQKEQEKESKKSDKEKEKEEIEEKKEYLPDTPNFEMLRNSKVTMGSYYCLPGPSFPTLAEARVAHYAGCNCYGITNTFAFDVAQALGIQTYGIACVFSSFHKLAPLHRVLVSQTILSSLLTSLQEIYTTPVSAVAPTPALARLRLVVPEIIYQEKMAALTSASVSSSSTSSSCCSACAKKPCAITVQTDITATIKRISQEPLESVQKAVAFVREKFSLTKDCVIPCAIISDAFAMDFVLAKDSKKKSVLFSELPGYSQWALQSGTFLPFAEWTLTYGTNECGMPLFVLSHSCSKTTAQQIQFEKSGFVLRMMKFFGVTQLLVIPALCDATFGKQHKLGDLVSVRDHINLTGENPLFGENVDAYGVRFPDMGTTYTPALAKLVTAQATLAKIPMKETISTIVCTPRFRSAAEALLCHSIDNATWTTDKSNNKHVSVSTLCTGIHIPTILARHMNMNVICVGIITQKAPQPHIMSSVADASTLSLSKSLTALQTLLSSSEIWSQLKVAHKEKMLLASKKA
eukprot:TRINITY_DN10226_c0_g1_i1.p1 TRINITY_DN10226_c0_g1~~TRINITY_DN10226_c0_g1_i1.p1  ORF type:complete len:1091 (+),score=323.10 TRINITY_DN10226_c0_g1_i1:54-3275(+)